MIKKTISFTDFNDEPKTETHYFHLSKMELVRMDLEIEGGMSKMLAQIAESKNGAKIIAAISDFILRSYGAKSPDGARFDKTDEIRDAFASSPAFDALLMELATDPRLAVEFIVGIIPKDLASEADIKKAVLEAGLPEPTISNVKGVVVGQIRELPDPNGLDGPNGSWPAGDPRDMTTGLDNPRDGNGQFLPWAFREPTSIELAQMSKVRMHDAFRRKNSGWSASVMPQRDMANGLSHPFDDNGELLPWAYREPTLIELEQMSALQLREVYHRRTNLNWHPQDS